jgi:demethylmenaquinone methyltransferase/2-methoxy-6-polyprenyl-1,4-benzoquinol methylase
MAEVEAGPTPGVDEVGVGPPAGGTHAVVDSTEMRDLYRKRAKHYDFAVWTYRLLGLRERMYRHHTVAALRLRPGDTVVDLACGTGLNFRFLQPLITGEGRIIGVDFTDAMLDVARKRAQSAGWSNIEFIQADMAEYEFPAGIAGVLSTFAISLVPQFDQVIHRGAAALRPGGRMSILDIKTPQHWPTWVATCTAWVNRPFGVTLETTYRRPWESLQQHLQEICYREYFLGYLYLSVGQKTLPRGVAEE